MLKIKRLWLILCSTVLIQGTGCTYKQTVYHQGMYVAMNDLSTYSINYGYQANYLYFVVFEKSGQGGGGIPKANVIITKSPSGEKTCVGTLMKPDGNVIKLETSKKIFLITESNFVEAPINFTKQDLERFLASKPSEYSISALSDYLKQPIKGN